MKLIQPKFEIIEQQAGLEGIYKAIELAGKVSHKSESNITEDSAKKFVDNMIKLGHGAPLEFGTVYLYFPWVSIGGLDAKYSHNKYSKVIFYSNNQIDEKGNTVFISIEYGKAGHYVTTNMRVLLDNDWLDDLKYICEPTEYHAKRYCVKFTCDRGVSHEFVRHRTMSFLQESTRYCNYSSGRFNSEITCIIPSWCNEEELMKYGKNHLIDRSEKPESIFMAAMNNAEEAYFSLLDQGWKPQQARQVLPNALKTELFMCGFEEDWKHFFSLRSPKYGAKGVHPDAAYLADKLYYTFANKYGILSLKDALYEASNPD